MSRSKPNVLRIIAEKTLDQCFGQLSPATKNELATSILRQWITAGRAVIVTPEHNYWFRMTRLDDGGTQVVREVQEGTFVDHLRRSRVIEEQIPSLLHELSLCQSVRCSTDQGEPLQLRVDPAKGTFHIEFVHDAD